MTEGQEHGEVFTRRWLVELILDLAGYKPELADLTATTIVEHAIGSGAFVGPANYVSHEGERPMAITWQLAMPLPDDLFGAMAAAVA